MPQSEELCLLFPDSQHCWTSDHCVLAGKLHFLSQSLRVLPARERWTVHCPEPWILPQHQQLPTHTRVQLSHLNSKQTLDGILLNTIILNLLDTELLSCPYSLLNMDKNTLGGITFTAVPPLILLSLCKGLLFVGFFFTVFFYSSIKVQMPTERYPMPSGATQNICSTCRRVDSDSVGPTGDLHHWTVSKRPAGIPQGLQSDTGGLCLGTCISSKINTIKYKIKERK